MNNSPVQSIKSNDMRCNAGGMTGVEGVCDVAGKSYMQKLQIKLPKWQKEALLMLIFFYSWSGNFRGDASTKGGSLMYK
jgi:hypothetical protein